MLDTTSPPSSEYQHKRGEYVPKHPLFQGKPCYRLSTPWIIVANLVLVAAYYFSARWALKLADVSEALTLVWVPSGLSLACLLLFGLRMLPAVALGALLVTTLHVAGLTLPFAAIISLGNTLEAVVGWWILRYLLGFDVRLGRLHDGVSFLFVAVPLAPVVAALLGAVAMCAGGLQPWSVYWSIAAVWYVGNALGLLLVTPLLGSWAHFHPIARQRLGEAAIVTILVAVTAALAFGRTLEPSAAGHPLAFLPLPAIIWGAMRFGPMGASLLSFAVAAFAIVSTLYGKGPFDTAQNTEGIKLLAAFVAIVAGTALCIACASSEARRTRSSLHDSYERYRLLLSGTGIIAWEYNPALRKFNFVSGNAAALLGYSLDDWYKRDFWMSTIHPDDRNQAVLTCATEIEAGRDHTIEYRMMHADGREIWVHDVVSVTKLAKGSPLVRGVLVDITERKRAVQRTYDAERKFRSLFEQSPYGVMLIEPATSVVLEVNPTMGELLGGYTPAELAGKPVAFFEAAPDGTAIRQRSLADGSGVIETRYRKRDGAVIDVLVGVKASTIGRRPILHCIVRDITRQKQDTAAIEASEQQFRDMFERHKSVMALIDATTGQIVDANLAAADFYGFSPQELRTLNISKLNTASPEVIREQMSRAISGERNFFEFVHVLRSGAYRDVEVYSSPIIHDGRVLLFSIMHDVTERKQAQDERDRLQAQVVHAQKFESLAVMAGGVAHDFNNLLTSIMGNTALAKRTVPNQSPLRSTLTTIEQSTQRAADLTRQLLAYSGKGSLVTEQLDLSSMVVELIRILEIALPPAATIRLEVEPHLPKVQVDATQVRQVAMNLLTNAADSLEGNAGNITISTGVMEATKDYLAKSYVTSDAAPGRFAYLQVADTGKGMDRATLQRIFDPFFTTKFTGRGLGLAAALGIIRGHKGAIKVESAPGVGTTFRLLFPLREAPSKLFAPPLQGLLETKPNGASASTPVANGHTKGAIILVVDDERLVRDLCVAALATLHHRTVAASGGKEALMLIRAMGAELAAVVLDVTMPEMSGPEVLWSIREMGIEVPIVFTDENVETDLHAIWPSFSPAQLVNVSMLAKPYSAEQLRSHLQSVLAAGSAQGARRSSGSPLL